ncbi:Uncharacterised protein [BD1-7 clade bacterium]|uniref:Uncharacterized protein n=1 Tax=BD1-7 clade bacterium TaxID=2029982 RepID=A0A5S9P2Q3_9GAMM|nr:Uncharacterised protein [BD1-7 clade bacterium]CAA0122833.1 Uncharacterised protein [BD1-7 clade bacterium]
MTQTEEIGELISSYTHLKQYFEGAREDFENRISNIESRSDDVIDQVQVAIPEAVESELYRSVYFDPDNGDDSQEGTPSNPLKSLKASIEKIPKGGYGVIFTTESGKTITIDEDIFILGKSIVFRFKDAIINASASIRIFAGALKASYPISLSHSSEYFIHHYSADIRLPMASLNPQAEASGLLYSAYNGGNVSFPGSHHSEVLVTGIIEDTPAQYYIFSPLYYRSSMIVCLHGLSVGQNVDVFHPTYQALQVGNKQVYLVGA